MIFGGYMRGVDFVLETPQSTLDRLTSYANGNFRAVDHAIVKAVRNTAGTITPADVAREVDRALRRKTPDDIANILASPPLPTREDWDRFLKM